MRVVVEGPDGGGKTTLIGDLKTEFELELMPRHADSLKGPQDDLINWVMRDLADEAPTDRIYDRHPLISEPIYGPAIRGRLQENFHSGWLIAAWLCWKNMRPLVVFCLPPEDVMRANANKAEQMPGAIDSLDRVRALYEAQYARMKGDEWWAIKYDYTREGEFGHLVRQIKLAHLGEETPPW